MGASARGRESGAGYLELFGERVSIEYTLFPDDIFPPCTLKVHGWRVIDYPDDHLESAMIELADGRRIECVNLHYASLRSANVMRPDGVCVYEQYPAEQWDPLILLGSFIVEGLAPPRSGIHIT